MSPSEPLPRLPYVLLVAMTIVSFAGPFVIFLVMRGGASPRWPPDRWIEWAAIAIVMGLFLALFVACLSIRLWFRRT
jgi:hypothetical protein